MASPAITKGSDFFFSTIYEGNGGGQKVGKFVPFTDNGTIAKSAIFNSPDNAHLSKTFSSAGNRRKFTISFWIKRAKLATSNGQQILTAHTDTNNRFQLFFDASVGGGAVGNKLTLFNVSGGSTLSIFQTTRTFENTSRWYHIVLAFDTTQATESNRMYLYVDGEIVTDFDTLNYPTQDYELNWNADTTHLIGKYGASTNYPLDAYLAEFNNVDGSFLAGSNFGLIDTSNSMWIPKTLSGITYGTNGFRLTFDDSSAIGDDTSGNTNDFTASNIVAADITTDSPTQNHATMSPLRERGATSLSEGNLKLVASSGGNYAASASTLRLSESDPTGYYVECKQVGSRRDAMSALIMKDSVDVEGLSNNQSYTGTVGIKTRGSGGSNQYWYTIDGNEQAATGVSHALNDFVQIAVKQGKVWIGINNTWLNSGNPSTGANPLYTNPSGEDFRIMFVSFQNNDLEINFGQKSYQYTPPTDFVAMQQDNLIDEGAIPDWVWIKNREQSDAHQIYDSSRGVRKDLNIDTNPQSTTADGLQKFVKGGCQIEDDVSINSSSESYVSWNWVCNRGTTSTNTTGSINCLNQVNSTAGFSIIQHAGNGTNGATIGHGLSQAPTFLITKSVDGGSARDWMVWHHKLTDGSYFVDLNQTETQIQSTSYTNSTAPSSTVITLGTSAIINGNGENYITYAFHEVEGYSRFGSYTGNGNTSGPYVYTGFKPAWVMYKNITTASQWVIMDTKRGAFNPVGLNLLANSTSAEDDGGTTQRKMDILSNGFKLRVGNYTDSNKSSETYIYVAFAEHPFVGNGTSPATAR